MVVFVIHKEQFDKSCAVMYNLGTNDSSESNLYTESVHKTPLHETG